MGSRLYIKDTLDARIKNGHPAPSNATTLRLEEIEAVDSVFQHRQVSEWASDAHVKALLRALKNTEKTFEPLDVLWAGDGWVLLDGHHRYRAYQEYSFDDAVPVKVFDGTLDEALEEALRANVQDELNGSQGENERCLDARYRGKPFDQPNYCIGVRIRGNVGPGAAGAGSSQNQEAGMSGEHGLPYRTGESRGERRCF